MHTCTCTCAWGCVVLTFVCPSGSPHTHWSAALRLIGHSDKKYRENHPLSKSKCFFPTRCVSSFYFLLLNAKIIDQPLYFSTNPKLIGHLDKKYRGQPPFTQLYLQLILNFIRNCILNLSSLSSDLLDIRIRNTGPSHPSPPTLSSTYPHMELARK